MWSFNNSFIPKDYLSVKQTKTDSKALARLRIHAHALQLGEAYIQHPLHQPVENRTCKHCPGDIENEYHFLIQCKTYCTDQENMYNGIERNVYN